MDHCCNVHILLGLTGSVAAIKAKQLIEELKIIRIDQFPNIVPELKVVVTDNALHFASLDELKTLAPVFCDVDEWTLWQQIPDPVLHIELRKWADLMVIAPLDANTLAKIVGGICDNLLTCIVRAWDMNKPLLFCPAMNTKMWEHPITTEHIIKMKSYNYIEIPCISKKLACNDVGYGAMAEIPTIVQAVTEHLKYYLDNKKQL